MELNSTSFAYNKENNISLVNYRENKFLESMVKNLSPTFFFEKIECISHLIFDIITESDFTTYCREIVSSVQCQDQDCKYFILRCKAVIEKIVEKRTSVFYTSHSDRLVTTKALNMLEDVTDFYCSQVNKNKYDFPLSELMKIKLHLNALKNIILICESIKRKHLNPSYNLLELPLNIQHIIFSKLPSNPKNYLNEIFKIKNLYTMNYMEGKLYQEILPEYINIKKIVMFTSCKYFSSLELMQMAPSLHFIDDPEPTVIEDDLFDVMQFSEFKSLQHLTIRNIMHLYPIISSLSKISSLQHLSIYMNAYQNIRPFHIPLNWIKYLKNLNNLKHIELNIKTYEPELTKDFVIQHLNMENVTVELEYKRKPRRLPAYSYTLC